MEINGIINLYKPTGMTSHTALNIARRIFNCEKAGHCGTLDPNASGVLPVMLGNAVKASDFLIEHDKSYTAGLILGYETDTGDITGKTTKLSGMPVPSYEEIYAAVKSFEGGYEQVPPMYSALKVNGRKLVDAARKGIEIERKPRHIDIYSIDLSQKDGGLYISVSCSRGTYIRTLCEDIGKKLKCLGCMGSLERTRVGDFYIENSVTLERLREMTESERSSLVIPIDAALSGFGELEVDDFFTRLIKDGNAVETRKLGIKNPTPGTLLRLYNGQNFFAVGEIAEKDGSLTLKHKKLFI